MGRHTDDELYGYTDDDQRYNNFHTKHHQSLAVAKGRRTKRQRSSSYIGVNKGNNNQYHHHHENYCSSSSTSDDHDVMSDVTTEEEDMANCLILLAQGVLEKESNTKTIATSNNINNNIITASDNSNTVYECKTCNKVFSSFQALGGHRTSHKIKPKPIPNVSVPSPASEEHENGGDLVVDYHEELSKISKSSNYKSNNNIVVTICNKSKNNSNNNIISNNNKVIKVHECSICGSEFPSGQALGGHMRRHRAPQQQSSAVIDSGGGARTVLTLDLNLPAPDDGDDHVGVNDHFKMTEFHVLSTPAAY